MCSMFQVVMDTWAFALAAASTLASVRRHACFLIVGASFAVDQRTGRKYAKSPKSCNGKMTSVEEVVQVMRQFDVSVRWVASDSAFRARSMAPPLTRRLRDPARSWRQADSSGESPTYGCRGPKEDVSAELGLLESVQSLPEDVRSSGSEKELCAACGVLVGRDSGAGPIATGIWSSFHGQYLTGVACTWRVIASGERNQRRRT